MASLHAWLSVLVPHAMLAAALSCARPGAPPTPPAPGNLGPSAARAAPDEPMSEPDEYRDRPVSASAGAAYFAETGVGDPYAAGIPYPVFLALMSLYPDELGASWRALQTKFAMTPRAEDPDGMPLGFHLTTDPATHVAFVMNNCALCHADVIRAAGKSQVVLGLGSKTVRIHSYDAAFTHIGVDPLLGADRVLRAANREAAARGLAWPASLREAIVAATVRNLAARAAARREGVMRLSGGLPGRVATIESFMLAMNFAAERAHAPARLALPATTGWAKIPDVRSFRYRETLSWDAVGTGSPAALAAEADFAFGVRAAWFDAHRHIGTSLAMFLRTFDRTLPFPGTIDKALAARGQALFAAKCSKCHGTYAAGGVVYRERVVPVDYVGTDRARVDAVTPEFVAAANDVPVTRGVTRVARTGGYVPPPLLDIWARAPYGHVGQWPTLRALATPPDQRPRRFVVEPSADYDLDAVGERTRPEGAPLAGDAYVYDGTAPGYGVLGHPFLADLGDDAFAVIEYLKGI